MITDERLSEIESELSAIKPNTVYRPWGATWSDDSRAILQVQSNYTSFNGVEVEVLANSPGYAAELLAEVRRLKALVGITVPVCDEVIALRERLHLAPEVDMDVRRMHLPTNPVAQALAKYEAWFNS